MKTTKLRTERLSASERREAIIDAAVSEFSALGLHGASTEAIATRVGISQPYIFRLFGTKKELFISAAERVCERMLDTFRHAGHDEPTLYQLGGAFYALLDQRDELLLLLQVFAASKDREIEQLAQRIFVRIYDYVKHTTNASPEQLRTFFAHGMLLMIAAGIDLPGIANTQEWARVLTGSKET